ncbi:MAG: c-type cytochrome [Candidatus Omnitrophica bacterium]|nr:c-type cytochrome [Candidatus Omnitrophota bacterium]
MRSSRHIRPLICAALFAHGAWCQDYLSPLALAADPARGTLYIAEFTGHRVDVFDIRACTVTAAIAVSGPPSGLAVSPDSNKLYVTLASPEGQVAIIDLKTNQVVEQIRMGHTPAAPVLDPEGKRLFVCCRFENKLKAVDLETHKVSAEINALREPFAAAITPDGKTLMVANLLPEGPSNADIVAGAVTLIDTASMKVAANIRLPNGSTALLGICISPDGKFAYVTHTLGRYRLPATQIDRGWINTNAVSMVDVEKRTFLNTFLLDNIDQGAANPWGVACTPDGCFLCVAEAGGHEVSVIDREGLHEKLAKVAAGERVSETTLAWEDVPNDLAFLVGLRKRVPLEGKGPRGIAVVGRAAYVAEYFSDSIGIVDLNSDSSAKARAIPLGPPLPITPVRWGEMLFHDASICFQRWQSCASCHPGEARVDGLNWDLLNDGIGTPKNTKSMLFAHQAPPTTITGIRPSAETSVRAGIRNILFATRPDEEASAIDAYLKSLVPAPSPRLVNGQLSENARRGREVFEKARCATCHKGPLYTDMLKYDVGTGRGNEADKAFDTPTLAEVWRTAPYLYDGRAADMRELLTIHNWKDRHGTTSELTDQELNDLIEFLLSI